MREGRGEGSLWSWWPPFVAQIVTDLACVAGRVTSSGDQNKPPVPRKPAIILKTWIWSMSTCLI